MTHAAGDVFAKKEDVVLRTVAGEHLLVPIRSRAADLRSIFALNGVALSIWELLDGQRSLQSILETIVARYEIGLQDAQADLHSFIEHLTEAELVERKG